MRTAVKTVLGGGALALAAVLLVPGVAAAAADTTAGPGPDGAGSPPGTVKAGATRTSAGGASASKTGVSKTGGAGVSAKNLAVTTRVDATAETLTRAGGKDLAVSTPTTDTAVVTTAQDDPTTVPSPSSLPTPSAPPAPVKVRTYSYGPNSQQRMDVWWHPDGPRRPAVFVIHGGWWSAGDKKYETAVSRSYADLGYTVVNLNYRLSTVAPWPAQRNDTIDAIATVRRHATTMFNTDPSRYVLLGFSAGGHIATATGTYGNGLPGLRGVVGISPVVSPLSAYADGDDRAGLDQRKLRKAALVLAGGCTPTQCPDTWASMEVPLQASAGDPPVLTVHSDNEFVPPFESEMLKQALGQVGVPMTIKTMPGTQHSAPLYREHGVAESVQAWIAARLKR